MGPTAGLDDVEKRKFLTLPGLELRSVVQPVASRYPGSLEIISAFSKWCLLYFVFIIQGLHYVTWSSRPSPSNYPINPAHLPYS
jgi:hypothetical protein